MKQNGIIELCPLKDPLNNSLTQEESVIPFGRYLESSDLRHTVYQDEVFR